MRKVAHLLLQELQNYNSLLKTVDRRMLDPTKKDTSCPGTKNKPQKVVGGAKSHLESNPRPARDVRKAQPNPMHTRNQRPHRD